jgi:hypothetical protein
MFTLTQHEVHPGVMSRFEDVCIDGVTCRGSLERFILDVERF